MPDLEASFVRILDEWVPPNQAYLARSAAQLIGGWAQVEAAGGSHALLEPLVLAWLTSPTHRLDLASLLLGALPPNHHSDELSVIADDAGVVELPGLGQFPGNTAGEELSLRRLGRDRVIVRRDGRRRGGTEVTLRPIPMVPDTRAVLAATAHPLLKRFYRDGTGRPPAIVETSTETHRHAESVTEAFSLLSRTVPRLHAHLVEAVRRVTVHRAGLVHSFATPAAHGAVFLAAADDDTEIGFVEDLVHQGGHVLCTAMTVDRDVFFKVPAETSLADITGIVDETRSLYEAFHGVFTEGAMILTLHRLLDLVGLTPRQVHEARGRLGLIASRTAADLAIVCRPGLFTDEGLRILAFCRTALIETIDRRRDELIALDLTGQPYAFSYAAFAARNPPDRART
jgi:hypothetical protein